MMQGLIVDWGGVLTMPIHIAIGSWLKATGVDHNHYGEVVRRWVEPLPGEISPVHRLERGEIAVEDFEHLLSAALERQGSRVAAEQAGLVGIVHRSFDETATELTALFPGAGWIHQRLH